MKRIAILGSTGSVGGNTLDVLARHPDRFQATVLAAGKNDGLLLAQCVQHRPRLAVMADADAAGLCCHAWLRRYRVTPSGRRAP